VCLTEKNKIMIQQQTVLKVADNSGAKTVKCIKVLKGFKRKFASVGDIIVVSVQQLRNKLKINSKVQKGEVYKALILRTRKNIRKKNGLITFFNDNYISLINKQNHPIATRIMGPVSKQLKKRKYMKFASISAGFL
jgi:large subunit ribosomal protein L14